MKVSTEHKYEVSVIVLTFNSSFEKLELTLESIVKQKGINVQIVISDDGSKSFERDRIERFFHVKGFVNYIIVEHIINQGTCLNYYDGLTYASGVYVKPISPGDYLSESFILSKWYKSALNSEAVLSFAKLSEYKKEDDSIIEYKDSSRPNNVSVYKTGDIHRQQLYYIVLADYPVGASFMSRRNETIFYMDKIVNRIKYCEDTIYQMMLIDGWKIYYFDETAVLYECNSGISTSKNREWEKKLDKDLRIVQEMISQSIKREDSLRTKLIKIYVGIRSKYNNRVVNYLKYVMFPQLFIIQSIKSIKNYKSKDSGNNTILKGNTKCK